MFSTLYLTITSTYNFSKYPNNTRYSNSLLWQKVPHVSPDFDLQNWPVSFSTDTYSSFWLSVFLPLVAVRLVYLLWLSSRFAGWHSVLRFIIMCWSVELYFWQCWELSQNPVHVRQVYYLHIYLQPFVLLCANFSFASSYGPKDTLKPTFYEYKFRIYSYIYYA